MVDKLFFIVSFFILFYVSQAFSSTCDFLTNPYNGYSNTESCHSTTDAALQACNSNELPRVPCECYTAGFNYTIPFCITYDYGYIFAIFWVTPDSCSQQKENISADCGGIDKVQCNNQCQCSCILPCGLQREGKATECGNIDNVQCDESCNCSCIDPCLQQKQAKVTECGNVQNVHCDESCNCSCKNPPPVSYWLMATRSGCAASNPTNICGSLVSNDGSSSATLMDQPPVLPCDAAAGGTLGTVRDGSADQPTYDLASSAAAGGNLYYLEVSLPATGTGFYVFAWDADQQKWQYKNTITSSYAVIAATACNVQTPSNCRNSFTFSCAAPSNSNPPEDSGGGACKGQGDPTKTCLNAGGVVWDDKSTCKYHCGDCQGQYADYVNTCVAGTLATYGEVSDCKYYCDCSKTSQQRNTDCPMGATVNNQTCSYTCKSCAQLIDQCKTDCQQQYGQAPVTNTCQESLMGAPYERECKCPPAGPQTGGGTGTGGTGTGTGTGTDTGTGTESCPECPILQQIKADTGALVRQGNDLVDRLGEIYEASTKHYVNNERLLADIVKAIVDKQVSGGGGSPPIDLSSVVAAVNALRDPLAAIHEDLSAFKTDMHNALYDGGTPYQAEMLAELRRLTKGFLETANGAQPNSFVAKFQSLTYLDENGNWTLRTSSSDSGTNGWDALIALLNAYFGGSAPSVPEFTGWDLTALNQNPSPSYQATQVLSQMDVSAAATDAATRYNSLPEPVITLLNPQPCITGASGLSICFNTDVWQNLYVQLRYWGYFFAHLTVFVMVYRARTGISPSASSDE